MINFDELLNGTDFTYFDGKAANLIKSRHEQWREGATKLVLLDNDLVYKIPYMGDDGYDFLNAGGELGCDYCDSEVANWEMAVRYGVADFFVETKLLCNYNDYPIYVQKRVQLFSERYNSSELDIWSESEEGARSISYLENQELLDITQLPAKWLDDAMKIYGEAKVVKLLEFLEDEGINDCRAGNIGYNGDRPVIFDYAGFYE